MDNKYQDSFARKIKDEAMYLSMSKGKLSQLIDIVKNIDEKSKSDYYRRLTKVNKGRRFIDQFLQGSGCELAEKFWSKNSSSRLAFDLYSWIPNVVFEKKLPGVICSKAGPAGVPNMDVYIELSDRHLFIESKYTEKAGLSYTNGDKPNLSKAYWDKGIYGGIPLAQRFYNNEPVARKFSNFCEEMQDFIDKNVKTNTHKWFDVKQETCHLFGVIMFALNARKENGSFICNENYNLSKKITLCNVIWKMVGDDFNYHNSLPGHFKEKAEDLINDILGNCFTFEIKTVQEVRESTDFYGLNFKDARSFELDNTVYEQMKQYERTDTRQ